MLTTACNNGADQQEVQVLFHVFAVNMRVVSSERKMLTNYWEPFKYSPRMALRHTFPSWSINDRYILFGSSPHGIRILFSKIFKQTSGQDQFILPILISSYSTSFNNLTLSITTAVFWVIKIQIFIFYIVWNSPY